MSGGLEERLEGPRLRAICAEQGLADYLVREHPEIAEAYRTGKGQRGLAWRYLRAVYRTHRGVARRAVCFALERLLEEDERTSLCHQRFEQGGEIARKRKLGALNPAFNPLRSDWGREADRVHAARGSGIIYDPELRKQALEARGTYLGKQRRTKYGRVNERDFILLARRFNYDYYGGWPALIDSVNKLYGNRRTPQQVMAAFRYWTQPRKKKEPPHRAGGLRSPSRIIGG